MADEKRKAPMSLRLKVLLGMAGLLLIAAVWLVVHPPNGLKSAVSQVNVLSLPVPGGFEAAWGGLDTLPEPAFMAAGGKGTLWVMGGPPQAAYLKVIQPDGTIAFAAGESSPAGFGLIGPLAEDPRGFLYHSDAHRVQKLDFHGTMIGEVLPGGTEGLTKTAQGPMGLALDEAGNLYVAETLNHRVQKLGPQGEYLAHWGHALTETAAEWQPYAVAAGGGHVYVSDMAGNGIDIFDSAGNSGSAWTGEEETAVDGFHGVNQVALRPDGRILVSEPNRVMEFGTDGVLTGMWVGGEEAGWNSAGVSAGSDGRVYVLDKKHHRVLVGREAPEL